MSAPRLRATSLSVAAIIGLAACGTAVAQKKYDPGATDTEIKIGNVMPYSGPASAYSAIGRTDAAYFRMINDQGGINGRKINFISYDDGYSPPRAVEHVRKLIEEDEVLVVFNPLGTPSNLAVQKYLNFNMVPQLFVATGASRWNDPNQFPWTIGWQPSYRSEGTIYAKWLLKEKPNAKIGILYQNDGFGKDYLAGVRDGLGTKADSMIAIEEGYDSSDTTIASHVERLKAANPDVVMIFATPKFSTQAIRTTAELDWKPIQIVANISASIASTLKPAGLENAQGILSAHYAKEGNDPRWADDPGVKKWNAFMDKYMPTESRSNLDVVYAYSVSQTLVKVLEMCGDDLSRANVMKQAASLTNFVPDMVLPGLTINTSAQDFAPVAQLQMMRFKGETWELFGEIISSDITD